MAYQPMQFAPVSPMQKRPDPGMALLQQVKGMQGGAGAGGGDPTQGLISRLMSGNPGGLIGALMNRANAPVNPGAAPEAGSPAYVDPGAGGMAVGPAMPAGNPGGPVPSMLPMAPKLTAGSSGDDIWNSYKAAGGGADLSQNQFVQNSQNAGQPFGGMMGMLSKMFGGMGG